MEGKEHKVASKGMQKVTKIQKYRRPLNINVGMVIFAVIFVYVCICISMYFKDNHIKPYEVREGSLASENLYTGSRIRALMCLSSGTFCF